MLGITDQQLKSWLEKEGIGYLNVSGRFRYEVSCLTFDAYLAKKGLAAIFTAVKNFSLQGMTFQQVISWLDKEGIDYLI